MITRIINYSNPKLDIHTEAFQIKALCNHNPVPRMIGNKTSHSIQTQTETAIFRYKCSP